MSVHLIAPEEKNEQVREKIEETRPKRYRFVTDTLAFVAPEGITVAEDVSEAIGMNPEEDVSGFVVRMESYAGRGFRSTLEWMKNAESAR